MSSKHLHYCVVINYVCFFILMLLKHLFNLCYSVIVIPVIYYSYIMLTAMKVGGY